ncbi:hypothetical protein SFRURICE_020576 [Spodoptera frugiperda]|uniref:SFRICE_018774 n=1 Tax=Spodoptera frugiperda TaxID=7108 RepID=A0A2H1W4M4_SPOFR|nr:hypothetical protein SFRURICE_020576 [Spodoptera frugiperda]
MAEGTTRKQVTSFCCALFSCVFHVNISNTWVLPEEGFPVFYRYFRDRISWYEADAVCQFHHANLVTGLIGGNPAKTPITVDSALDPASTEIQPRHI